MTLLFDVNMSPALARVLADSECATEHTVHRYGPLIPDAELITACLKDGVSGFVTRDYKMRGKADYHDCIQAYLQLGCIIYFSKEFGNMPMRDQIAWFREHGQKLYDKFLACPRGHFLDVARNGSMRVRSLTRPGPYTNPGP